MRRSWQHNLILCIMFHDGTDNSACDERGNCVIFVLVMMVMRRRRAAGTIIRWIHLMLWRWAARSLRTNRPRDLRKTAKALIPCGIRETKIKYKLSHYTGYRLIGQDRRYFCIWIAELRGMLARSMKRIRYIIENIVIIKFHQYTSGAIDPSITYAI